jgi:hypothetical protein
MRFLLADRNHASASLAEVESLMTGVVDQLGLTALVDSITGLSVLEAEATLAETGTPTRFASARPLVAHAGLAPPGRMRATRGRERVQNRSAHDPDRSGRRWTARHSNEAADQSLSACRRNQQVLWACSWTKSTV